MDPLSIAASISGLLSLAGGITSSMASFTASVSGAPRLATCILNETQSLVLVFEQLQGLLEQRTHAREGRTALISVDQIRLVLTGSVVAFSELEAEVDDLGTADNMGLWDRVRWAQKEANLNKLLERLEVHKTSLGLILTILLCHSNAEAEKSTSHLTAQVEKLVESNERLVALVQEARPQSCHDHEEDVESIPPVYSHILRFDERTMVTVAVEPQSSIHGFKISRQESMESVVTRPVRFSFEDTLYKTRVYTRTVLNSTTNSFKSAQTIGSKWTQLTGLSLAQISNISVIHLPICASDIPNSAHWFKFGSHANPSIMGDHLSEIMEVSTVHAHSRQNSDGSNVASEKHWDNADTETIRERSPSRASRGDSGSYALLSALNRDPSLAEELVPGSLLHPQFQPYLLQETPLGSHTTAIDRLLSLPVDQLENLISSVGSELARRTSGASVNGDGSMFALLSHEGLCTLVTDLDFVLKRRQLRLSSSAYDIQVAAHPSDWPLENIKAEDKEDVPQTKFQFDLNVSESSLSQLPSPMGEYEPDELGSAVKSESPTFSPLNDGANGHIELPKLALEQITPEPRTRSQLVFDIMTRRNQKPVQLPCPEEDTCRMTLGIFGDSCTGKSQLLVQCPCPPTIEDRVTRSLDNGAIVLDILDTGGSSVYRNQLPGWISETQLFLLVYRPDLDGSWIFLVKLIAQIRQSKQHAENNDVYPIFIFENRRSKSKGDSDDASRQRAWALANECVFVSGDCMDEELVESVFLRLARRRKIGLEAAKEQAAKSAEPLLLPERERVSVGKRVRKAMVKRRISRDWLMSGSGKTTVEISAPQLVSTTAKIS